MKLYQFFKNAKRTKAFNNPLLALNVLVLSFLLITIQENSATVSASETMEAHRIIGASCFPLAENDMTLNLQLDL